MPTPLIMPSFAAGEISPALHGRVDLAKYQVGLATCLNWFIHPFGGASTRAGTAFVGEVYDSAARSRLIPFQFNTLQTYVLEFANLKMRVIMDGGYVLETATVITGISQAATGVVTAAAHGFSNGDHVWIEGVAGMVELNRRRFTVAGVTANTFELSGIDTSGYGAWTASGTVARFYTIATPYVTADLALLKFVQSADTMTLTHPSYAPRNLTRTGHTSWTLSTITYAPTQQPPTAVTGPGGANTYVVTAISDETGEESLISNTTTADNTETITWTDAAGATSYNVYKARNGVFGFIGRAGSGASGFTDATIDADTTDTPPQSNNPFNAADKYPGCSTWHDGRQWYARTNTKPQTLYASVSASFNNMNTSSPTKDSDAITRTIASREVNEIRFLLSLGVLLVLTSGGEWKCWAGGQSDVLTPANCNVKPQGYTGIAQIPPITTANAALFVTPSGRKVRDIGYEFASDTFSGRDLSILSGHLFEGVQIEEWAYAKDPDSIVWCVRSDGVGLAFTYLKEHDVYAWARMVTDGAIESVAAIQEGHETALYLSIARTVGGATKRYVERMASRQFTEVSDAWCVDCGYSSGVGWNTDPTRTLEITTDTGYDAGAGVALTAEGFTPFTAGSVGDKYILRSGQDEVTVTVTLYIDPATVVATLDTAPATSLQSEPTSDWSLATTTMRGLWHLEGRSVVALADGNFIPAQTVTNGTITLARAAARVVAGLAYDCDLETLDIERGEPTMQGRRKRVQEVTLRVKDTRGLKVGPTSDRLVDIKERTDEQMGEATRLTTGDEPVLIDPSWNSNGRVFIRQSYPLPATVVAIIPRLEIGE